MVHVTACGDEPLPACLCVPGSCRKDPRQRSTEHHADASEEPHLVNQEQDIELLKGPHWLNDQIVAFFFEYLTHEGGTDEMCFLPGAASFFLLNGDVEDLGVGLIQPLKLKEKEVVFVAVNNNPDVTQAEGGSHWSLLVWDQRSCAFVHLDSCGGMNDQPARQLAGRLHGLMAVGGSVTYLRPSVPQQCNACDCALYMLKFTEILSKDLSLWTATKLDILKSITPDSVSQFRAELLDLIESKRD